MTNEHQRIDRIADVLDFALHLHGKQLCPKRIRRDARKLLQVGEAVIAAEKPPSKPARTAITAMNKILKRYRSEVAHRGYFTNVWNGRIESAFVMEPRRAPATRHTRRAIPKLTCATV